MLIIRKEQFEALSQTPLNEFKKRLLSQFLSPDSPYSAMMSKEDLARLIDTGVTRARSYDIIDGADMKDYIAYMIAKGEDFDETDQRAKAILNNAAFDGEEKIEELDIYFEGLDED